MNRSVVSGHFIDSVKGPIFVLLRRPNSSVHATVLVVPPFAEEMNKCRRMLTETALALAGHGYAFICPDLFGTGDSAGDFAAADWETWRADLCSVSQWSRGQGLPVTHLLGIRLGAALAVDCVRAGQIPWVSGTAFWQPLFNGSRYLTQFLRLRIAASLMNNQEETAKQLRDRLRAGETVDVAGYAISSRLAADIDLIAPVDRLPTGLGGTAWFEISRDADAQSTAIAPKHAGIIDADGTEISVVLVPGEPFWASTEIVINRSLVLQTVKQLLESCGRGPLPPSPGQ